MGLVEIEYDDVDDGFVDIAGDVLYRTAAFESQLAAIPGMFEMTVKDVDQTYDFVSGREIRLTVDGQRYWGGFLTQVEAFYATIVDTAVPADVKVRQWSLRGVDYNILFDKRVLSNYANPTSSIPQFAVGTMDGDAITTLIGSYLDTADDDLDLSGIENVASLTPDDVKGAYGVPGEKWRQAMQRFANTTGSTWYIDATKRVVNREREDEELAWGFSDVPDGITYFGSREIRHTVDGSSVVNDALIWGGSGFQSGKVAFGRVENTDSINRGLRMQFGATHFNKTGYFTNKSCRQHASVIVTGAPGTIALVGDGPDSDRGLQNPQQLLSQAWFYGMVPGPLTPGIVVTTRLFTFGSPKIITLPLRSLRITFLSPTIIRFDGTFGIQTTDPYSLWSYMKRQADEEAEIIYTPPIPDDATEPIPGGSFNTNVSPAPDGSTTVFSLRFPYTAGSTRVYRNGLILVRGTDYTESDPEAGEITMTTAPSESDQLYATAQAVGTGGDGGDGGAAPAVTHPYSGTGSGLQAFINSVPDGSSGNPNVIGLNAADYSIGSGMITLDDRHHLAIVGAGPSTVIHQTVRQTDEIIQLNGGTTDISLYDLTIQGANPNPGKWDLSYEHNHGVALRGIYGFRATRVRFINVSGDGVYIGGLIDSDRWSQDVTITYCTFDGIGRMANSIADGGRNVVIEHNSYRRIGYYLFDVEPNGLTIEGVDAGADGVSFSFNTILDKPWGDYPDDPSQAFGYGFATTGASGGGPARHIDFIGNAFTQSDMRVHAFNNGMDNEDINVQNNTAAVEFVPDGDISYSVEFDGVTGGSITGNFVPCNPDGAFESHSGSTGITVSGNEV